MGEKYDALLAHMKDIDNIGTARSLLAWDQRTQMPPQGGAVRASQIATLSRIYHEMFTSETTARLIEEAASEIDGAPYDSHEASLIRLVQRDYEDATRLPSDFVKRMSELTSRGQQVWAKARAESDFAQFQPVLEQIIEMTLEEAELRGYDDHPYDALLDQYDRDLKMADVRAIFDAHKPALIDLIAAVSERQERVDDSCLHQLFDIDRQRQFALDVVCGQGVRLRFRTRAAGYHRASLRHVHVALRHAHHHSLQRGFSQPGAVRHDARGRSRDARAGLCR